MKRKVKFVEPETIEFYCWENRLDALIGFFYQEGWKPVRVRIIRERDYQKLLKLARGRK